MLTQAHNKAHVVFDEQNRECRIYPHKTAVSIEFGTLIGVHASRRLVQQQQLGIRCQRSGDLQLALLSVGQAGGRLPRFSVQIEDLQQLHCLFIHGPLLHKIGGQTQNSRGRGVFHLVMQPTFTLSSTVISLNRRIF